MPSVFVMRKVSNLVTDVLDTFTRTAAPLDGSTPSSGDGQWITNIAGAGSYTWDTTGTALGALSSGGGTVHAYFETEPTDSVVVAADVTIPGPPSDNYCRLFICNTHLPAATATLTGYSLHVRQNFFQLFRGSTFVGDVSGWGFPQPAGTYNIKLAAAAGVVRVYLGGVQQTIAGSLTYVDGSPQSGHQHGIQTANQLTTFDNFYLHVGP